MQSFVKCLNLSRMANSRQLVFVGKTSPALYFFLKKHLLFSNTAFCLVFLTLKNIKEHCFSICFALFLFLIFFANKHCFFDKKQHVMFNVLVFLIKVSEKHLSLKKQFFFNLHL